MIGDETRLGEQRLEDLVFVGIDRALHDVLAEAPGGVDQHDLGEAGLGVDREHDAGAAQVGAHHLAARRRERDLHVVEALGLAVADGAVGEQRGVAAPAGVEQGLFAADVEEGLLLAGEARVRQVFGGGAAAHRDAFDRSPGAGRHFMVSPRDRLRQNRRKFRVSDHLPNLLADRGKAAPVLFQPVKFFFQTVGQIVGLYEFPIGGRGRCVATGHANTGVLQLTDHFSKGGVFAADCCNIGTAQFRKPADQRGIICHDSIPSGVNDTLFHLDQDKNRQSYADAEQPGHYIQWLGPE